MHELRLGGEPLEAVLLPELGARLHRLRAFGHDLLRTPPDPTDHRADPLFWGGYVMAPWCNRIAAGDTSLGRSMVRLDANFPDGSAIHGQVYARPWTVTAAGMLATRAGGDGWPWAYEVTLAAEVLESTLSLRWRLTNLAGEPMPAGIGFHPWWRRPLRLRVDGSRAYASNSAPADEPQPVSGALDLRELGEPADGLDGTWTDAAPVAVGLVWQELGLQATLTSSARYVAVATPPNVDAIAVEPQTHAPDGLRRLLERRTDGLAWLAPGASLALDLAIRVSRA